MDTKKLRQKILDLAIHGKLVPQDPNDEPASVLLERIRTEKERLVKEGKIKKSKASKTSDTPHYENVPFEVPSSWEWTTLGEIFTLQAGKNITAKDISEKEDPEHRFPCYGGNGLRGYVCGYNRNGRFPLIGRQGALCGNINLADGLFYATEHAVVVETYCETDVDWAVHTLTHLNLNQYATSTAQPGLSVSTINEILIPLPPIEEQRRIVNCLNKWLVLIDQIEQEKADLQTTIKQTKSKILDLATHGKLIPQAPNDEPASELLKRTNPAAEIACDNGQYGKMPKIWGGYKLGDVASYITDFVANGSFASLREHVRYYDGKEYAIIVRTKDFQNNFTKDLIYTDKHGYDFLSKSKLFGGELMLPNIGASIGKVFIIPKLNHPMTLGPNSVIISFKDNITKSWAYYLFLSPYGQELLLTISSSTAQGKFNKTDLRNTFFPLPPLGEQHRIVAKIEELFSSLENIQKALEV